MTVRVDRLANGLTVVTERMPGLGSASIGVWVGAGCRHERPEENGVAHFLEHMAFKGTARRSAIDIAVEIENVGGYLNAYTSRETTAYYARVLGEDVPLALDLIADILRAPAFAEAEIASERGVILQEIGQALDTPDDVVFDWLQEVSYPAQAMGRPILGLAERVRTFSAEDLRSFTSVHYAPERMILSAAGAVDHDEAVKLAQAAFGDMARGPAQGVEPARFMGGERRKVKRLEQAHVAMAFEGPAQKDGAAVAAQVFSTALGGGMSSRLFQEARERRGLCYSIFAHSSAFADTGAMTIYAGTGGKELPELTGLVIDELRRAAEGMSADEVARARAQLKAGLVMGMESPSNRAERLARSIAVWGRVQTIEELVEQIDAVDVAAARDVGARICAAPRPALALYGPVARAPGAAEIAERLAA
ncbi:M16 family metallopeptidase [Rubrimonas cliftonensis]|uniref:Predicted Zn-dependent peptidase n=1 Tax=Rubrimonas cliftonensis TaxID=89524 RepID=A0A1H4EWN7_9RHOB|nr:pitrilysin family protein [Rubrimonas cliftonensis]SEA89386.1 Predicted Zn-dependent peptidase [Rubrimonas cliftonensis]